MWVRREEERRRREEGERREGVWDEGPENQVPGSI